MGMQCLLAKVMERGIFRVPARRKRKVEVKPSDIPPFTIRPTWRMSAGCATLPGGKTMADLRKAARGRECQVRIPGICNGNPETTVLAHIRIAGLCGTGIKPPDLIATIACSSCHDEIDRRTHLVDAEYAKECALEGMARTQVIWLKEGKVKA